MEASPHGTGGGKKWTPALQTQEKMTLPSHRLIRAEEEGSWIPFHSSTYGWASWNVAGFWENLFPGLHLESVFG